MMSGGTNNFTMLVFLNDEDTLNGPFKVDGKLKQWDFQPSIQPFFDKRRKKQKPQADISDLTSGALVLNEKAYHTLRDFLLPFGQLLPVDCSGEIKYFFNVTNIISCIDIEKSGKVGQCVTDPVFLANAIPAGVQVFKDPLTVGTAIYLTPAAKVILEQLITTAGLTGLVIFKAGDGQ